MDHSHNAQDKQRVAKMGVWFVVAFISGLRGEEMLLIERAGTANSLKFLQDGWFKIIISRATKGNQLSGAKFGLLHYAGSNIEK